VSCATGGWSARTALAEARARLAAEAVVRERQRIGAELQRTVAVDLDAVLTAADDAAAACGHDPEAV
jgi:signal transduction histidine kinase